MAFLIPGYLQLVERQPKGWFQKPPASVINFSDRSWDSLNKEKYYGLTKTQIVTELFRKYQGKLGYYLVNLATEEYHYCGAEYEDIGTKLKDMGITRDDRD